MKPRISLRGLLVLTTCLAAVCWWRDRPRQIANRFVAAIEAGDYEAADAMFVRGRSLYDETVGHATFSASQYKPSLADWMRGERFIDLNWEYPERSLAEN